MASTCPPLQFTEAAPEGLGSNHSLWELYGESFDGSMREPASALIEGVRAGTVVVLAAEDAGRTVGLAAVHLLSEPAIPLLLYLAVTPELRGQRIGSTLLEQVVSVAAEKQRAHGRTPRGWAVQVEMPELAPSVEEREHRRRVQLFFRGHGAKPLPCSYLRPPVRGGTPSAARLLHAPAGGLPLKRDEVGALLHAIYFEKYGVANGVDRKLLLSLLGPAPAGAPGAILPGASPRESPLRKD